MKKDIKCQICGKPATVHLTQIIDNKIHKIDLCEECAKEKGVTDPEGFSLFDLLVNPPLNPQEYRESIRCEHCGFTPADFKRLGRLGCPHCYDTFAHLIRPILTNMHKDTIHKGKIPSKSLERISYQEELKKLESKLNQSVEEERYEDAARYRDQITHLREQSNLHL